MSDQKPKEKRVRVEKLQALSDELLKQRAEAAIAKIESKKQRYQQAHQLNMMRLSNYEKYKLADKGVCLNADFRRLTDPNFVALTELVGV